MGKAINLQPMQCGQMLCIITTLVTMQTVRLLTRHYHNAVLACTDHSLHESVSVAVYRRLHCIACHEDD